MYGRHVFMGYLGQEVKTQEVIDEQGYLHTGDIGKKDRDGFLHITGESLSQYQGLFALLKSRTNIAVPTEGDFRL